MLSNINKKPSQSVKRPICSNFQKLFKTFSHRMIYDVIKKQRERNVLHVTIFINFLICSTMKHWSKNCPLIKFKLWFFSAFNFQSNFALIWKSLWFRFSFLCVFSLIFLRFSGFSFFDFSIVMKLKVKKLIKSWFTVNEFFDLFWYTFIRSCFMFQGKIEIEIAWKLNPNIKQKYFLNLKPSSNLNFLPYIQSYTCLPRYTTLPPLPEHQIPRDSVIIGKFNQSEKRLKHHFDTFVIFIRLQYIRAVWILLFCYLSCLGIAFRQQNIRKKFLFSLIDIFSMKSNAETLIRCVLLWGWHYKVNMELHVRLCSSFYWIWIGAFTAF